MRHKNQIQQTNKSDGVRIETFKAYPGAEFVANTLAKWKKLEPNEINFKF